MRTDCKHYESRTYPSGDVVQKCKLDLAPEAPWRCPADCPKFDHRMVGAGWQYGSLAPSRSGEPEPDPAGDDIAKLLDEAEDIVNTAGAQILSEQEKRAHKKFFRRKKRR